MQIFPKTPSNYFSTSLDHESDDEMILSVSGLLRHDKPCCDLTDMLQGVMTLPAFHFI
jgi:hypothetical protein